MDDYWGCEEEEVAFNSFASWINFKIYNHRDMSCIFINLWTEKTVIRSDGRNMLWYLIAKGRQCPVLDGGDGGIDCESRDQPFTAIKVQLRWFRKPSRSNAPQHTYWCELSRCCTSRSMQNASLGPTLIKTLHLNRLRMHFHLLFDLSTCILYGCSCWGALQVAM